jgi:hypothetical protein
MHWSEDKEFSARVHRIFRSLPPNTWDVYIWRPNEDSASGTLDVADAHSLIGAILKANDE